jgi:HEAT repeat protein
LGESIDRPVPKDLAERLQNGSVPQRREAAERLLKLGPRAAGFATLLLDALADEDETVRECVTACLEDCGPPPKAEVAALPARLAAAQGDHAYWTITLLARSGDPSAVEPIADVLADAARETAVRERAAWALGELGENAKSASQILSDVAAESDGRLKRLAERALKKIGPK